MGRKNKEDSGQETVDRMQMGEIIAEPLTGLLQPDNGITERTKKKKKKITYTMHVHDPCAIWRMNAIMFSNCSSL